MAGVHFTFDNFKQLLDLSIGLVQRLDENRAESFTLLYCDFSKVKQTDINSSLEQILRNSDSISNSKSDYFFILPYTDKYGAAIVKNMFSEFFAKDLNSCVVSYPIDGEKSEALIEELKNLAGAKYKNDLTCLNSFNPY
ncbi:MAG: hypothetical protein A2513_00860 [Sulfurimonas sp. RIFOXYD12_FULL_33_39]|uniref:hypothetical protein n=1 Tax=unclassified Sulfurimonas TaxID=2623549 RepID=UPI0008C14C82|nr:MULTISPECIES: hypothetical protein [unclassified Sulfurimonas]OHE07206.1 MAG: hypothetical protein A3G74_02080 [Sulfurimonas sp. RIFCSPLOWO2_12_FULL_34_6]OHE10871.1 MAG: hypothetical protein A2513_00860 [Sulfurimonas sp. RIFOXYD12_FULL_33_39]OHE13359.1 MAG: hypothetical protein A2530_07320 [Sulfurimonas sp. RIFOXYD2_FULL_34_21]DAB27790.1 MAG TPA: hypothetical protein CFH78_05630 [Sulfurimonas sp. UBA10385]